ncbi:RNA-directed DNA polymerase, eukaryota, reverse transcriptase zinc-binding domain protein [Tanacetum coccineum]
MFCTFVYAANGGKERRELWKDLQIHKRIVDKHAWIIMGDMNVTLATNEHFAGSSHMSTDMNEFKDYVNSTKVEDVVSSGLFYTWTKNLFKTKMGDTDGVLKKLDRIMGNEEFFDKFSQFHAIFHPYLIFDHCPNTLIITKIMKAKKKAFKFANFIAEKEDFLHVVKKAWENQYNGCQMFKTVKRLKSLKAELRKLAWKDGNIFDKVQALKVHLKDLQTKIDMDPYNKVLRVEESKCIHEYVEAMKDEEKLLYQKAKIKAICFKEKRKKLSPTDADFIISEVYDEEIKEALFQINGNKAPGPDGFSSLFFKKAWDIVGKDVCKSVKEFFDNGKMLKEINSTIITLIPKIETPNKVTDFRPIACCNVIYKCISKVITNRIKGFLGYIVGQYQSAFVPNRHIQDNILLSQELFNGYDRKEGPKRVAMKIDIQKAYDTVNWKFLEDIHKGFGFHEKMGDPMSPYLFTLVMEIMSLIVQDKVERNKEFGYHFKCKHMKLTHVCFADDLLMFCYGDKGSIQTLKEAIEEFGSVSGLKPNYDKSTIIFGSIKEEDKQEIMECVPFKVERPLPQKEFVQTIAKALLTRLKTKFAIGGNGGEDIVENGVCVWPEEWTRKYPDLAMNSRVMINNGKEDETVWRSKSGKEDKFSIRRAYQDLCDNVDDVKWHKIIWFSQNIPKHSFILWMAIQNKLITQDKIRKWGSSDMMACPLCRKDMDSHHHLFFQCEYAASFWSKVQAKVGMLNANLGWSELVGKFSDMYCGNSIDSIIRRLSLAACVYLVWQERNWRLFREEKRSPDDLLTVLKILSG